MKTYHGARAPDGSVRVFVEQDGSRRPLDRRDAQAFDYGYDGAGPAELARGILRDHLGRPPRWWLYRAFLHAFIAPLDRDAPWSIGEAEIAAWLVLVQIDG